MIEGSATVQRPRPPVYSLAIDDAPWGGVLVHQPDGAEALELQRILRIAGYRVIGPAASQSDVERFLARNTVDCALIDARAGFELGDRLDECGIPFAVVCGDVASAVMWRAAGRLLVPRPYRGGEILRAVHQAMRSRGGGKPERLRRMDS
jgi:FixJ family two-component response regulator